MLSACACGSEVSETNFRDMVIYMHMHTTQKQQDF